MQVFDLIVFLHVEEDFGLFDATDVQPGSKRIDTVPELRILGDMCEIDEGRVIRQFG